jgi:phage FluMu protein Com
MLRVACPQCQKSLGLPDTAAGKSVKCPQCQAVFQAPSPGKAVAAKAIPAKPVPAKAVPAAVAAPEKPYDEYAEATPYGIREDAPTPEQLRKSAQGEAVDQMVIDAKRTKKRNQAWDKIGTPAKFVKRFALMACIFWLCTYIFLTMMIVLANHNMENAAKEGGFVTSGGVKSKPKYLFVQEIFPELTPETLRPVAFWGIISGGLVVALAVYGLQLAGAEQMKRLENYRLSLFAMVIGTLTLNLFGIWGLLALMDKGVQYEFKVSQRRRDGFEGEAIYNHDDEEEEEEDDDDEDEEEDEDEDEVEEEKTVSRKKR